LTVRPLCRRCCCRRRTCSVHQLLTLRCRPHPCQVQHYHVTVTLLLTLADALRAASSAAAAAAAADADGRQRGEVLAAGAAHLAAAVLQRRLKALYFCLSSDMRGKANAALALLEAVVATCGGGGGDLAASSGAAAPPSLHDFVRAFDWSLSALPGLARPPRWGGAGPCTHCKCFPPPSVRSSFALPLRIPSLSTRCPPALNGLLGAGRRRGSPPRTPDAATGSSGPWATRSSAPPAPPSPPWRWPCCGAAPPPATRCWLRACCACGRCWAGCCTTWQLTRRSTSWRWVGGLDGLAGGLFAGGLSGGGGCLQVG
jgi:hypothetical protein